MAPLYVMLKGNMQGTFRRTLRDKKGDPLTVLDFPPGKGVEVTAAERELLEPDMGVALLDAEVDKKGRARPVGSAIPFEPVVEAPRVEVIDAPAPADDLAADTMLANVLADELVELLAASDLFTVGDVRDFDDLTTIGGIGRARADAIREATAATN